MVNKMLQMNEQIFLLVYIYIYSTLFGEHDDYSQNPNLMKPETWMSIVRIYKKSSSWDLSQ